MKKLIVIVAFLVVGYKVLTIYQTPGEKLDAQYPEPYIVVYGRQTDGNTVRLQTDLLGKGLRYHYVDMTAEGAAEVLQQRMKRAGLDTVHYVLPVVEVNARIQANPKIDWVVGFYRISHSGKRL